MENPIYDLYLELSGRQKITDEVWKLWCKKNKTLEEKEEIIIGSILTQGTNWRNVEKALYNLRKKKICSINKINVFGRNRISELEKFLQPCGFYRQKAKYLYMLCQFLSCNYQKLEDFFKEDLPLVRQKILSQKGIGPETADTILLYAGNKLTFVIDEYTRRLVKRNKISQNLDYHFLQKLFQRSLPKEVSIYQKFHVLIVENEKLVKKEIKI
ncbi:MAG: endonuclease [bacterium]|nr:endonuclease [bacterium]